MADSKLPGGKGTNPNVPSPRTGGPSGVAFDAASPDTPTWFRGDTPGTLGVNDYASPDSAMCRVRSPYRLPALDYKSLRAKIMAELKESYKIRDGFANKAYIEEANKLNLDGQAYNNFVAEKLFGKSAKTKLGELTANASNPMYTHPYSCNITEDERELAKIPRDVYDIVYRGMRIHEETHSAECHSINKQINKSYALTSDSVEGRSATEIKAYTAQIEYYENWLRDHPEK